MLTDGTTDSFIITDICLSIIERTFLDRTPLSAVKEDSLNYVLVANRWAIILGNAGVV